NVPHISAYNLTVEEKTALHHLIKTKKSPNVSDEQGERNFQYLRKVLIDNGFIHYEISNFGKEGYFSQHNTSYLKGINYLGIGPSAHSYNGKSRKWNVANNNIYLQKITADFLPLEEEILTPKDIVN